MSRKFTSAEKGKNVMSSTLPPPIPRVKVPAFDSSELRKKHSLTIIGRLTNPSVQKMWSMIPFLADLWKTSTRPIGADLGQGRFQFQFANEADLLKVLDKQPYHFAKWMVILERWEPTSSRSFPSKIPFWIEVQGIPVHLWSLEALTSVAKGVGHFEKAEISAIYARIRVTVDGLQPLVMQAFVDFEDGEEVLADLLYEKLEGYCKKCHRLDHGTRDCPGFKSIEARHRSPTSPPPPPRREYRSEDSQHNRRYPEDIPRHQERKRRRSPEITSREDRRNYQSGEVKSHHGRDSWHRDYRSRSNYQREDLRSSLRTRDSVHQASHHHHSSRESPVLDKYNSKSNNKGEGRVSRDYSSSSRNVEPGSQLIPSLSARTPPISQEAVNVAMGELREVMVRYVNCTDPTESAARKERYKQAEELGEVEETAIQMVRASQNDIGEEPLSPVANLESSAERIPASLRLGPLAVPPPPSKPKKRITKKRLGRPPGKKKATQKERISPKIPLSGPAKKKLRLHLKPIPRRRLSMDHLAEIPFDSSTLLRGSTSRSAPVQDHVEEERPTSTASPAIQHQTKSSSDFRLPAAGIP